MYVIEVIFMVRRALYIKPMYNKTINGKPINSKPIKKPMRILTADGLFYILYLKITS